MDDYWAVFSVEYLVDSMVYVTACWLVEWMVDWKVEMTVCYWAAH